MNDREFLERVELELRAIAVRRPHATVDSLGKDNVVRAHHVSDPASCDRCRLEKLADEAADRIFEVA